MSNPLAPNQPKVDGEIGRDCRTNLVDRSKDCFVRLPQVRRRTGLSIPTIYRKIGLGEFPRQVKLSAHVVAWYEGDIDRWVADPMGWRDAA